LTYLEQLEAIRPNRFHNCVRFLSTSCVKTVGMIPIEYISGNVSHRRHNLSPVELHRLRSEVSAEFGDAEKLRSLGSAPIIILAKIFSFAQS